MSKTGDPLETFEATVDFEYFRSWLVEGLGYGHGSKGGRPPFDPVSMFKALILQTQHNLSDAHMEFMISDQLSWMRFLGFDLGAPTPDENTIRHFRNRPQAQNIRQSREPQNTSASTSTPGRQDRRRRRPSGNG
nr:transposase [Nitratireductor arenosus]